MIIKKQIEVAYKNMNLQNYDYKQADHKLLRWRGSPVNVFTTLLLCKPTKPQPSHRTQLSKENEHLIPPKEFKVLQIFILLTSQEKLTW